MLIVAGSLFLEKTMGEAITERLLSLAKPLLDFLQLDRLPLKRLEVFHDSVLPGAVNSMDLHDGCVPVEAERFLIQFLQEFFKALNLFRV